MKFTRSTGGGTRLGRTAVACTLAFALIALGVSCSSEDKADEAETQASVATPGEVLVPAGDPVDGGRLAIGVMYDTSGWNPTADRWGVAIAFAGSSMIEPLATLDEEGKAQPWLATTWLPNEDFTIWTVTLREGITFHNGEPFDAAAVKANMDDVIGSALTGIALGGAITGTDVVSPYTVQIHTSAPWAAFPTSFLAGPNSWMRAPAMLAAGAEGSKNPIGTGPFKFTSWENGRSLQVAKNPTYWREGEPHLEQMEFFPIVDDLSRADALDSGDLDMMLTTSARDADQLDATYQVIKDWDTEATTLVLNTRETAGGQPNPLANVHARRALAHATDARVISALLGENIEVPVSPFSEASPWGDPSVAGSVLAYDKAAAQKEIEQYKADTGATSLSVKILGPTETTTVAVLQTLADQWAEVGIETEVQVIEQNDMSLQGVQGNFQVILGPIYTAPDPDQNYHFWSATTVQPDGAIGINFTGYATEQTQAALDNGRSNADVTKRGAFYTDLAKIYNEQALNVWLYFTPYSIVAANDVHGLEQATVSGFGSFQPTTWWGMVWKG